MGRLIQLTASTDVTAGGRARQQTKGEEGGLETRLRVMNNNPPAAKVVAHNHAYWVFVAGPVHVVPG